jgi:hypothetical protein
MVDARSVAMSRYALIAVALAAGVVIALVDSSPGWDSTGITAGILFLAAATVGAVARDRPWLWALLIGTPTPLIEVVGGGSAAAALAVVFAAAGAIVGWLIGRAR